MKRFYAAENQYGSESSHGFANTWTVLVFKDKASRDEYIKATRNITTEAICKRDIPQYIAKPKPFTGQARVIDAYGYDEDGAAGCIGTVIVDYPDRGYYLPL